MEYHHQQGKQSRGEGKDEVELPYESSPYVQSKNVEDYNMRGYGTKEKHKPVELPQRGGGTEAPTSAGSGQPQHGRINERAAFANTDYTRQPQPAVQNDEDFDRYQ